MKTPDLTPAQIKADVALVLGVAASVGLNIDGQTSGLITAVLIGAFALAHFASFFADAKIRGARARAALEIGESKAQAAFHDPVVTAEKLERFAETVIAALDANFAAGNQQAATTKIPVTEGAPGA